MEAAEVVQYTYTVHDLIQWAGLIGSVLGIVWWFQRDRKAHRADVIEITRWRVNVERDIGGVREDIQRRVDRDGRLYSKLEEVCSVVKSQNDRLLRIETLMEADRQNEGKN